MCGLFMASPSRNDRTPPACAAAWLLDWTARGIHPGKPGSTPQHIPRLLDRLGVNAAMWQRLVSDFGRLFSVVAGQPHRIDEHQPKRTGSGHRYRARRETRELFSTA
jgi:hypothetical protein